MRRFRPLVFPPLALWASLTGSLAFGAEHKDYADEAFDDAQRAGKSILVVVGASWCPVCKVQESILSIAEHDPRYADVVVFFVNFDSQKDALWRLDARQPATVIGYKGDDETARTVGATRTQDHRGADRDNPREKPLTLAPTALAFVAGLLSILSPCVLPLVPIVFGTAASEHRLGPVALAAGVTLSFVAIGLFVATVGLSLGIDGDSIRTASAIVLALAGLFLATPSLQARLALAGGQVSNWADARIERLKAGGLAGQFGVGLLLGAVWSPCAGPTLGAASALAAQGGTAAAAALTMASFGVGAALPLALVGIASRAGFMRWRGAALLGGKTLKTVMGLLLVVLGGAILTGLDRPIEAALVAASPDWLVRLTTSF